VNHQFPRINLLTFSALSLSKRYSSPLYLALLPCIFTRLRVGTTCVDALVNSSFFETPHV
jgi:hypothetical protein